MPPNETLLEKAKRRVIEAERRLNAQKIWIADLTLMGYDTSSDITALDLIRRELLQAREELARVLS